MPQKGVFLAIKDVKIYKEKGELMLHISGTFFGFLEWEKIPTTVFVSLMTIDIMLIGEVRPDYYFSDWFSNRKLSLKELKMERCSNCEAIIIVKPHQKAVASLIKLLLKINGLEFTKIVIYEKERRAPVFYDYS